MHAANSSEKPKNKKILRKIIIGISAVVICIVLSAFFILPVYLSSRSGNNLILSKINSNIPGKVRADKMRIGWFKGVRIEKFNFADNAGAATVSANKITTRPNYISLLAGDISLGKTEIDRPVVSITSAQPKPQTEAAEKQKKQKSQTSHKPAIPAIAAKDIDLRINDGLVQITDPIQSRTTQIKNINTRLMMKNFGQKVNLDLAADVADEQTDSRVVVQGEMKSPGAKKWSFAETSGVFHIEVNDLNISSIEPLINLANKNIAAKGIIKADIDAAVDKGALGKINGTVSARNIDISGGPLKANNIKASKLNAALEIVSQQDIYKIDKLDIDSDWGTASMAGQLPKSLASLSEVMNNPQGRLQGKFQFDIAKLIDRIPGLVRLPADAKITSGLAAGNISTTAESGRRVLAANISLSDFAATKAGKAVKLSKPLDLDIKIASQQNQAVIEKLGLNSSFAAVNLNGTPEAINYTGRIDLGLAQSEIGSLLDIGTMAGLATLDGKAFREKQKMTITGKVQLTEFAMTPKSGIKIIEPAGNIDYQLEKLPTRLSIGKLDIGGAFGKLAVKGIVPIGKISSEQLSLNIDANADLAKIRPWAAGLNVVPADMVLAGNAAAACNIVQQQKNIYQIKMQDSKISDLRVEFPGKEPLSQKAVALTGDLTIDTLNKTINIKQVNIDSDQIKVNKLVLEQQVQKGHVKTAGNLVAEYDLAAVSTLAGAYMPQGLKLYGKRSDNISFTSTYPAGAKNGLMQNLNTAAQFGFDRAEYMGLNIAKTDFNLNVANGLMKLAPFSTKVNDGNMVCAGEMLFNSKTRIFNAEKAIAFEKVNINRSTTDALLQYVNPFFANLTDAAGTVNFRCDRLLVPLEQTRRNDINIAGTLSLDNGRINGSPLVTILLKGLEMAGLKGMSTNPLITIKPTAFTVSNGYVVYSDMSVLCDNIQFNFSGKIGLDKSLNMRILGPWTSGGRQMPVILGGTVDKPEIDFGEMFKERLIQEGQKILEKLLKGK